MKREGTTERLVVTIPSFLGLCKEPALRCGPSRLYRLDSRNLLRMFSQKSYLVNLHDARIVYAVFFFSCNKMSETATPIPILSTWKAIMGWNSVLLPFPGSSCLALTFLYAHHPDLELEFLLSNHHITYFFKFSNQNWSALKKLLLRGSEHSK